MKKRILTVDDELLILKTIRFRLEREGYEVHTAAEAELAMQLLETEKYDLVITDLLMPVHSGLEIIQKAKAVSDSKLPVIILSAAGLEKNVIDAFRIGADDFINKPFSPEELVVRIKKLL